MGQQLHGQFIKHFTWRSHTSHINSPSILLTTKIRRKTLKFHFSPFRKWILLCVIGSQQWVSMLYPSNTFHSSGCLFKCGNECFLLFALFFSLWMCFLFHSASLFCFPSHNLSVTLKTCVFVFCFYQWTNCSSCWHWMNRKNETKEGWKIHTISKYHQNF